MKYIKALWIGVTILVLFVTLYAFDGESYSDIWILLTWLMLIFSFPAGLLISLVHMILGKMFAITITTSYFSLTLEWIAYFLLGYIQWFMFLPWLIGKIRNSKLEESASVEE